MAIRTFALAAVLVACCAAVAGATTFSGAGKAPRRSADAAASGRILWGAWVGNAYDGEAAPWNISTLSQFTNSVKHAPSIVHFYQDFETCTPKCALSSFPSRQMTEIRSTGAIPMLSWASMASTPGADASLLSIQNIASGKLDGFLRRFAEAAKRWGHPFFLRFDWEMNDPESGFPWVVGTHHVTAREYVAAWRHIHDIFTSVGASNATWVFCPVATNDARWQATAAEYPGNAYVNWTGLDGYNWGTSPTVPSSYGGWQSFAQIYAKSYRALLRLAPAKPVMIAEVASGTAGGSKPAWLRNALTTLPKQFPAIRALVYFDAYTNGENWPLNSSMSALDAFSRGIADPVYATNHFSHLGGGAIAPPT